MKLTARKKKSVPSPQEPIPAKEPPKQPATDTLSKTIQIRCNTLLYTTLQNMITSMHTAGDYSYTSVADVIRAAIQSYQDGLELTEQPETGAKKQTTLRVSEELFEFYESWPARMRSKILERVVRSFIKSL